MTIQNSSFGFIDYLIDGVRQRVACQFFRVGSNMLARLVPDQAQPITTAVSTSMRAEILGAFSEVLERYKEECRQVLASTRFWTECAAFGGAALALFQIAHHMRLFGAAAPEGIEAWARFCQRLRTSERSAANGIRELLSPGAQATAMPTVAGAP
ncbi:hypothetical protein ACWV27_26015 (plasmid) [Massilia varians]|jgi:hypothetical protein|uniref:hypothetical protein n=1 Tax=Massilia sp. X63 TaxID=3237285 RepID=UPI0034DD0103